MSRAIRQFLSRNTRISVMAIALGGAPIASEASAKPLRAILLDAQTGVVLLSSRADAPHPPASLAKLMTLYLVFDGLKRRRFKLDTRLRVSRAAARQPASKIYLSVGEKVRVQDLINAVVVKSANDAAVVLAEGIGGTEQRFAWLMTATARRLGMRNTRFRNATGLDRRGQVTTARDMARLAQAILRNYPEYYANFARARMQYRGRHYRTSNRMLRQHWQVDGMKIGYTTRGGYSFVASAKVGNRRVLTVVLGESSARARFSRTARLLRIGFARARGNQARYVRLNGRLKTASAFNALKLLDSGAARLAQRDGIDAGVAPAAAVAR